MKFQNFFLCHNCHSELSESSDSLNCLECGLSYKIKNNVLKAVNDEYHSNFGFQWNLHRKTQLDSFNGSNESEKRLLNQSQLSKEFFKDKVVLEIGAGNGRFTELFLKYGAKVVACDYSSAIFANQKNNACKNALFIQADLFKLSLKESFFDVVVCYGVVQHTGKNNLALDKIYSIPIKQNGTVLIDIYSNSLKHFNPLIYLFRIPFFFVKKTDKELYRIVERFVKTLFPIQKQLLKFFRKLGFFGKFFIYLVNRSPNSVYGINLYLDRKISRKIAFDWCVLDTFDAWMPKHDNPMSFRRWKKVNSELAKKYFYFVEYTGVSGQGNVVKSRKL